MRKRKEGKREEKKKTERKYEIIFLAVNSSATLVTAAQTKMNSFNINSVVVLTGTFIGKSELVALLVITALSSCMKDIFQGTPYSGFQLFQDSYYRSPCMIRQLRSAFFHIVQCLGDDL